MSNWERREINNLIPEKPEDYKRRFPKPFSSMIPADAGPDNKLATEAYVDSHSGGGGEGGSITDAVKYTSQSLTDAEKSQARVNIEAGTYDKPSTGIPASDMADGVIPDVSGKEDTSNKVTSLSAQSTDTQYPSAKTTYDAINPSVQSSQPAGGFAPNVVYDLGELTGSVTFALASPTDNAIPNAYHWTFDTGSTAPTITWPAGIIWPDGFTPSVDASMHYEVLVRNGYASMLSYSLS